MEKYDRRYRLIRARLELLSVEQLKRIRDNADIMCLDTYNYDAENNTFCPLALALNYHRTLENPSQSLVESELSKHFQPVNILKGVPGEFYQCDRKADMLSLINELLIAKKNGDL